MKRTRPLVIVALILGLTACGSGTRRRGGGGGGGGGGGEPAGEGEGEGAAEGEGEGAAEGEGEGPAEGEGEGPAEGEGEGPTEGEGEGPTEGEGEGAGPDCYDDDGDGYGEGDDCLGWDCDDRQRTIHPDAPEDCDNRRDDDCDGAIDESDEDCAPGCIDRDGDGYGEGGGCDGPDCDDGNRSVNPGAREVCGDNRDNDCDGQRDEGCGGGGELGCWEFYDCLVDCEQDAACATDCQDQATARAQELLQSQDDCIQDNCPDASNACVFSRCADELNACVLDTEGQLGCGDLNLCLNTCPAGDAGCQETCAAAASAIARAGFDDLMECVSANCQQAPDVNVCAQAECPNELDACFGPA